MIFTGHQHRRGYTMMEMLFVLAILVIIAAIAIPVVTTSLSDARVSASGDTVRGKLAETRARASEDGVPWKLAFIPGTGIFQLAPEDSPEWNNVSQTPDEKIGLLRDSLPEEVIFAANDADILSSSGRPTAGNAWQTIAVYMPDGSARDDAVVYTGKPGQGPIRINVRGLTGSVTVEVSRPGGH